MLTRKFTQIVTLALLIGCSPQESAEELLLRAGQSFAQGDFAAAEFDSKTALQQDANNAAARLLLGRIYLRQMNPEAAVTEFERAFRAGGAVEAQVLLAQALVASGQAERLLELKSGEPAPIAARDPVFLAAVARAYISTRNFDEADAALRDALARAPADPYVNVSEAFMLLNQPGGVDEAKAVLQSVVEAEPDSAEAWSLLGEVARFESAAADAETYFRRAAEINPARLQDRLKVVDSLIRQNKLEAARNELSPLDKRIPNHPRVNLAHGQLLMADERYEDALQRFANVLNDFPDDPDALYLAAKANSFEENFVVAETQLVNFLKQRPDNIQAKEELATLLLRKGEPEEAEKMARALLSENTSAVRPLGILALALSAQGEHLESAATYDQIAAVQPGLVDAEVSAAMELIQGGEVESGVNRLKNTVAANPQSQAARERLIGAYMANRNYDAAREAVRNYIAYAPDSAGPLVIAGQVELAAGERAAADRYFEQAKVIDRGSLSNNGIRTVQALLDSDINAAIERMRESLDTSPGDLNTLMNLAVMEEQGGNLKAMAAYLQQAVDANPDALRPRVSLARHRLNGGDVLGALELINPLREAYPDEFELHHISAGAYLLSNQVGQAKAAGRELLRLQPEGTRALAMAARIALTSGDTAEAVQYLDKALQTNPLNVRMRVALIQAYMELGEMDSALAEIGRLPDTERAQPAALNLEGQVALAQGRAPEAERLFKRAFDVQRNNINLLWLINAQWVQGKRDIVFSALERWLDEYPDDLSTRTELSTRLMVAGEEARAQVQYEILLKALPNSVTVLNNLAWLTRDSDTQRALELIRRASEIAPDSAQVRDTYAMVQRAAGDLDSALATSQKALAAGPEDKSIQYHRALILVDAGRVAEARALLKPLAADERSAQRAAARDLLRSLKSP